ncbi:MULTISPECIES: hypothetical protein [unclassified Meiothermus]|uniref:hypothetical protein n=1 Tax=unclassified Meiothermus TaxID=370471 RepID=UPI000D7BA566|nr:MULTISPECIES: hypothetical protein [unclassified Meiothermus]PZA06150.1 hypothetical protein DNA98_14890 [Meiothermus sp. Pnk-1]RYM36210.1 hypothetical protein EWH23_10950 [Meiothermus sp. PNK-Is4]
MEGLSAKILEDEETLELILDDGSEERLLIEALALAEAFARLEEGEIIDPDEFELDGEEPEEIEGGQSWTQGAHVPEEGSYTAAEVELIEPKGLLVLRRLLYPGEDTLEMSLPNGAVYTFDYPEVLEYLRPLLPR